MVKILLLVVVFVFVNSMPVVTQSNKSNTVFKINNPDYRLSPYTGMNRQHWIEAAEYMLAGAFGYVQNIDDPMRFPKQHDITYPRYDSQIPTEKLEGLTRTLFVAAPLLKENPDLSFNGIKVAEYYRHQILNLTRENHPSYIRHRAPGGGPSQILVEFGALAISLFTAPEVLWHPLTQVEKDRLAALMMSYGNGPTIGSNWRFFNIFIMSFFKTQGYPINDALMKEYLQKSLEAYSGYGWYNDSPAYDYYSMWAFQMYGILWAKFFGNEHYPEYAAQFMKNFNDLHGNYAYLFARDGRMIMWSRSIAYRYAAVTPFMLMGLENDPDTNWGWMRRISSGNLLQFFKHPLFMEDGVPTLGFYGPFEPAVQMYSCRGSVYWGGKVFLGLLVPENHPFWQAKENEGSWENKLRRGKVFNKFQPGSNTLITNYPNIGASEVRAWCHETVAADWQRFRSTENYNRLAYHSEFLWQADGKNGEIAMNYGVINARNEWEVLRLYTFRSFRNGVYHRDAVLETNREIKFTLKDIPLPNGTLRVDKVISPVATSLQLGHYALPEKGKPIQTKVRRIAGNTVYIADNGIYQIAMAIAPGFRAMEFVTATGLNPDSERSTLIRATTSLEAGKALPLISVMLWRKSGERFRASDFKAFNQLVKQNRSLESLQNDPAKWFQSITH